MSINFIVFFLLFGLTFTQEIFDNNDIEAKSSTEKNGLKQKKVNNFNLIDN